MYQISILPGEKLIFNGTQNMAKKPVKKAERSYFEFIEYEQNDEGFKLPAEWKWSELITIQYSMTKNPFCSLTNAFTKTSSQ
ncbi:unnamed protein product [Rhizophagus irregularis]|nr:unnamed protein product [Rhizophagus irregularis]